jgi:MFS family permease
MEVEINWFAVLAASLVGFAVGVVWYGPLFGKAWMKIVGLTEEDVAKVNMGKIYVMCLVLQLIMATNLAMFLGPDSTLLTGTLYGFLTGFGWVALALAINAMFEQKSLNYMLINGGYWSVVFTLMGLILGAWH